MDLTFEDLENKCLDSIKKNNISTFLHLFPFYQYKLDNYTSSTPIIICFRLLTLLNNDMCMYYQLQETYTTEDPHYEFVFEIEKCLSTGSLNKLNKIASENKYPYFKEIIFQIISDFRKEMLEFANNPPQNLPFINDKESAQQTIIDSIFVIKELSRNY
ncbi:hypothetical protein CWI38_0294p0030 [Hamiltosporidium tvaerminnensis]|uniref:Uncharacterized protein n=2 Tax=Hamiltosporidium TaxID=1176354 RepID=A0A4Q9L721_9MICR|nr:hypothetical protein LUQ84_001427 [Hamiltosporidium tvaerminnensis]TBT99836.1 hypothetical protein CWI37_1199p0020 [Hamiltosporidium tvaerminnensis]TBU02812.1 hypothetical protein CWI36_1040p0020 [Hamiltosporidium magnivora]TBU03443.1 hypothetical protein CWI39_0967p0020 [Hamiltosporidium magnivora]TBU16699.1 hypothetical protein CWI38_0294p0030 [Hamiltosporidium tvaerminnensis]